MTITYRNTSMYCFLLLYLSYHTVIVNATSSEIDEILI